VTVIDGKFIDYNNIADIALGKPIAVENLIVHLMSLGDTYNLETRKFAGTEVMIEDEGNEE
jgi:cyanophycinase